MATKKQSVKQKKPYIMRETIWKSVGGGFSNPGESKVMKVGKYKVLLSRSERLNYYGNPVHTATVINKDGTLGPSSRGDGTAAGIVCRALGKSGVDVRYK
ncbi:MAG: hypothetical protein ACI4MT_04635 [Christensenellales bacterium]